MPSSIPCEDTAPTRHPAGAAGAPPPGAGRPPQAASRCSPSCCGWTRCAARARIVALLAIDFAAIFGAIFTALALKDAVLGDFVAQRVRSTRRARSSRSSSSSPCCSSRARTSTRAARSGPGMTRIVAGLFQVTLVALGYARAHRRGVLELLHLLRLAGVRRALRLSARAFVFDRATGVDPPRRRLPAPRAARRHRRAHRGRRPRARREPGPDQRRRLHLAHAAARTTGCARSARWRTSAASSTRNKRRRGHHRRPRVPPAGGGRARRRLPPARRPRPRRAVDDGDPHPPRRVRPGPVGPAVRAQAAGVRGRRLRDEAHVRPRRRDAHPPRAQPGARRRSRWRSSSPRAARSSTARCARASAARRSRA